jgi:hypothetical protein
MRSTDPGGPSRLHSIIIGLYLCLSSVRQLCLNGGTISLVPSEDTSSQASGQVYVLAFLPRGMKLG